jgi:tetratricopeptide (TPR) repeat protein
MFQLCVSQHINETPYPFKATGIRVYSFEEALYHVYHYWKQSVDDFLSDELITWVNDTLGLSYLAARMKELTRVGSFNQRMLGFLQLADYFSDRDLKSISQELTQWEMRMEWENLKERADDLINRSEPAKALTLYHRALQYGENAALLNNIGVAHMQSGAYKDAFLCLTRALVLDKATDLRIVLHYAEAAAYCRYYDKVEEALAAAKGSKGHQADVAYIKGLTAFERCLWPEAIACFEQAIELTAGGVPLYVFKLADVYLHMRLFEKALAALERVAKKEMDYFVKQAELHGLSGNAPAAAKCIQRALVLKENDASLWTKLAMYRRMDYDLTMADAAINKALSIAPENEYARLESARIKKALGRTREYQAILNQVLKGFKQRYREPNPTVFGKREDEAL